MSKATTRQVEREVRAVEQRLRGIESVQVMMHRVQVESLKKAETLRKASLAVVNGKWGTVDGWTRVSAADLKVLTTALKAIGGPFYKNPGPMPKAMRQLLARHRKG